MTVALAALLLAAPPDSSLATRNPHQQMLAAELAEEMRAAGTLPAPAEAAAFAERLAETWAARVPDQPAAYRRLGTYPAMWSARHLLAEPAPADAACEVWERFAVPAFVADVGDLAGEEPSMTLAPLFYRPNLDWAYGETLDCVLPDDTWRQLTASLRQYVEAADAYLASSLADDDPEAGLNETYIAALRASAARLVQTAAVEGAIRDGDLDAALADLAVRVSDEGVRHQARPLGRRLALAYAERGETDRALAVYDLLGRSLSDELLPSEALAAWYAEARAAADRIDRVRPGTRALLVPSDQTADLSGTFRRVGAEGAVDLASVRGGLVLLDFWSVNCGPCIEQIPTLNRLASTYGDRLTILSVNNDVVYGTPLSVVEEATEKHGIETTVLTDTEDGALTKRFDVAGWPLYLLIDGSGRILQESREGRRALTLDEVERYVRSLG